MRGTFFKKKVFKEAISGVLSNYFLFSVFFMQIKHIRYEHFYINTNTVNKMKYI